MVRGPLTMLREVVQEDIVRNMIRHLVTCVGRKSPLMECYIFIRGLMDDYTTILSKQMYALYWLCYCVRCDFYRGPLNRQVFIDCWLLLESIIQ